MLLAMSSRRAHSRSRSRPHHGVRTPPRDARRGEAAARGGRDQHHPRPGYGLGSGSPAAGPAGRPATTPRQRAPLAVADASGRAADREVEEDFVCPVCMDTLLRQAADFEERTVKVCDTCPEEHRICRVCFRQAVTSVLNNRDAYGPHANGAVGLRCPGVTGSRRCSNLIPDQLLPLANAEETSTYTDRLLWAATPPQQRFRCPSCSAQVGVTTVDGQRMSHGQCPSCSVSLCVACQVAPFHTGMTCEVFQARGEEAKGVAERATDCFVAATSKVCPGCGEAISHYHGHQCHHISPVTDGCSNCRTHFCFQCLHVFPKGSNHRCPNGCSSFCKQENLANFISTTPVPHDTRCGCVFCPDCLPGKPCDLCDGQCVVCRGIVSSGATSMPQAAPSPAISIRAATPPRSLRPATPLRQGARMRDEVRIDIAAAAIDGIAQTLQRSPQEIQIQRGLRLVMSHSQSLMLPPFNVRAYLAGQLELTDAEVNEVLRRAYLQRRAGVMPRQRSARFSWDKIATRCNDLDCPGLKCNTPQFVCFVCCMLIGILFLFSPWLVCDDNCGDKAKDTHLVTGRNASDNSIMETDDGINGNEITGIVIVCVALLFVLIVLTRSIQRYI